MSNSFFFTDSLRIKVSSRPIDRPSVLGATKIKQNISSNPRRNSCAYVIDIPHRRRRRQHPWCCSSVDREEEDHHSIDDADVRMDASNSAEIKWNKWSHLVDLFFVDVDNGPVAVLDRTFGTDHASSDWIFADGPLVLVVVVLLAVVLVDGAAMFGKSTDDWFVIHWHTISYSSSYSNEKDTVRGVFFSRGSVLSRDELMNSRSDPPSAQSNHRRGPETLEINRYRNRLEGNAYWFTLIRGWNKFFHYLTSELVIVDEEFL